MSDLVRIQEYVHEFGNFDVYPRVYHFYRRYKDLVPRFTRVTGALPKCFHDDKLMREIEQTKHEFEGEIKLSVIGKRDINKDDLVFKMINKINKERRRSMKATPTRPSNKSQWQGAQEDPKQNRDNPVSKLPDSPVQSIGIVILHIGLEHLTERYFQEIGSKFKSLTFDAKKTERKIFVYITCDTTKLLSNEDITRFQDSVFAALHDDLEKYFKEQGSIFIDPIACDLKTTISDTLEKYLANGFVNIYHHLKQFEPKNVDVCLEPFHVFETESVVCSLKAFLRNARAYVEVTVNTDEKEKAFSEIYDSLLKSLCHMVRCSLVNPFARKHGLKVWICNGLLYEVQFEEALSKAISKETQNHIKPMVESVYVGLLDGTEYSKKTRQFDFLYYAIKSDVEPVIANVEKKLQSMQKLSTIIRKMAFEAHGYLKQLNVASLLSFAEQQQSMPKELRQDLLNLKGVYGLGTVNGQLEIHLDKDAVLASKSDDVKQDENNAVVADTDDIHLTSLAQEKLSNKFKKLRSEISLHMRKHDFKEQFIMRYIEKKHMEMGRSFEPGDRLFQRDRGKFGTLGGFIITKDGKVHGLTCAHVVGKNTFIDKDGPCPFSSCPKVINRRNSELKHVDIAALEVIPNSQELCKQTLKECNECITMATVSDEYPEMIVGIPVFKYGAASGFTKGFIVSVDYSILEVETEDYLVMIDIQPDLPADFEETFDPITCTNDQTTPGQIALNDRDTFDEIMEENNMANPSRQLSQNTSAESSIITENNNHCAPTGTICACAENVLCLNDADMNALENMQSYSLNRNVAPKNTIVYVRNLENNRITFTDRDTSDEIFAKRGDSGSIICIIESTHTDIKHKALSMLSAGDLKIEGDESLKCLSFKLSVGFRMLKRTHNLDF